MLTEDKINEIAAQYTRLHLRPFKAVAERAYKDMQVDHVESVYLANEILNKEVDNSIENYMPSCRMCNYYKGTGTLEMFRERLGDMLMRNVRLPFDYRLALKYGLVVENVKPIVFYFEKEEEK